MVIVFTSCHDSAPYKFREYHTAIEVSETSHSAVDSGAACLREVNDIQGGTLKQKSTVIGSVL